LEFLECKSASQEVGKSGGKYRIQVGKLGRRGVGSGEVGNTKSEGI